jgi:hypothetical protein
MPDGELLQGEYSIVFASSIGFGDIFAAAYGAGGAASANGFSTNVAISGSGQGSAVLSGDRGHRSNASFSTIT